MDHPPKDADDGDKVPMLAVVGRVFIEPPFILGVNLLIGYIVALCLRKYAGDLPDAENNYKEVTDHFDSIGVLFIGWSVALEERAALRDIFRIPGSPRERRIDALCHTYGVGLLVLALFSEMATEFVKLPNDVANTAGIDEIVIRIGQGMIFVCFLLLAPFSLQLLGAVRGRKAG